MSTVGLARWAMVCCICCSVMNANGLDERSWFLANMKDSKTGDAKAAEQGHVDAQYNLGVCYNSGTGVPQDLALATLWYIKSAKQGHAEAQDRIAICYWLGNGAPEDYIEAYA